MKTNSVIVLVILLISLASVPAVAATPDLVISIDSGTLMLPGDSPVFYFTTTANGALVNPDSMSVKLYGPNNLSVVLAPTSIASGIFTVGYNLTNSSASGFYALVIIASYSPSPGFGWSGAAVKGFQVSQGLTSQQGAIVSAINSVGSAVSSSESDVLAAIANSNANLGKVNGSLSAQIASLSSQVSATNASAFAGMSVISSSIGSLGASLQASITASQSSVTSSVNQSSATLQASLASSTSSVLSGVSTARDNVINAVTGSASSITADVDQSFKDTQTWEYVILAVAAIGVALSVMILIRQK